LLIFILDGFSACAFFRSECGNASPFKRIPSGVEANEYLFRKLSLAFADHLLTPGAQTPDRHNSSDKHHAGLDQRRNLIPPSE
jgi:hypothetical protein